MKKIYLLALGICTSIGVILTSCGGGVNTNPTLSTEADTLAYALGVELYETGLNNHMTRMGVVTDTNMVIQQYNMFASQIKDPAQLATMESEKRQIIDSLAKVNTRNIAEFMRGLEDGVKATSAKDAYASGLVTGRQLEGKMIPDFMHKYYGAKANDHTMNKNHVLSGIATGMLNKKYAFNDPVGLLNKKVNKERAAADAVKQAEFMKLQEKQLADAKVFFEENAKKEGVITVAEGMQYKILKKGTGAKPTDKDRVTVHYEGRLLDGTVFDSSLKRGKPTSFGVTEVIRGWTQALQLMPVGSKWEVYIPQELGYGAQGAGKDIKPYSTLIFQVELLSIDK